VPHDRHEVFSDLPARLAAALPAHLQGTPYQPANLVGTAGAQLTGTGSPSTPELSGLLARLDELLVQQRTLFWPLLTSIPSSPAVPPGIPVAGVPGTAPAPRTLPAASPTTPGPVPTLSWPYLPPPSGPTPGPALAPSSPALPTPGTVGQSAASLPSLLASSQLESSAVSELGNPLLDLADLAEELSRLREALGNLADKLDRHEPGGSIGTGQPAAATVPVNVPASELAPETPRQLERSPRSGVDKDIEYGRRLGNEFGRPPTPLGP
jgi:hypothetical protein